MTKKRLAELKDKKGKEGEFTFNLNPESELATKHKTADTTITIRKTLDGKDRKSTRLNSSHSAKSRMPSSA